MTREELWARVHAARGAFYGGDPLYRADLAGEGIASEPRSGTRPANGFAAFERIWTDAPSPAEPVCPTCGGGGTVVIAFGPVDESGVRDETTAVPCPMCPAGDAVAEARIGRSWRADERGVA